MRGLLKTALIERLVRLGATDIPRTPRLLMRHRTPEELRGLQEGVAGAFARVEAPIKSKIDGALSRLPEGRVRTSLQRAGHLLIENPELLPLQPVPIPGASVAWLGAKKGLERLIDHHLPLPPAAVKTADLLPGGRADGRKPAEFDPKALARGARHEREHTNRPAVAREIAEDHLVEDPHYYEELERMEAKSKTAGAYTSAYEKVAFETSVYSGPLSYGAFPQASQLPPMTAPPLERQPEPRAPKRAKTAGELADAEYVARQKRDRTWRQEHPGPILGGFLGSVAGSTAGVLGGDALGNAATRLLASRTSLSPTGARAVGEALATQAPVLGGMAGGALGYGAGILASGEKGRQSRARHEAATDEWTDRLVDATRGGDRLRGTTSSRDEQRLRAGVRRSVQADKAMGLHPVADVAGRLGGGVLGFLGGLRGVEALTPAGPHGSLARAVIAPLGGAVGGMLGAMGGEHAARVLSQAVSPPNREKAKSLRADEQLLLKKTGAFGPLGPITQQVLPGMAGGAILGGLAGYGAGRASKKLRHHLEGGESPLNDRVHMGETPTLTVNGALLGALLGGGFSAAGGGRALLERLRGDPRGAATAETVVATPGGMASRIRGVLEAAQSGKLLKAAAALTPAARLSSTMQTGRTPNMDTTSTPSIAETSKPIGFGTKLPGAGKGTTTV